jgi:hypothetical protein
MLDTLTTAEKLCDAGMPFEQAKRVARAFYRAELERSADFLAGDLRDAGFADNQADLIARLVGAKLAGRDLAEEVKDYERER